MNRNSQHGPLDRFPAVRTANADEWERALIEMLGARRLEVLDQRTLPTYGNFVQLNDIALGYSDIQSHSIVSYNESPNARLKMVMRGHAIAKTATSADISRAGSSSVASPNQAVTSEYGGYLQMLFLRIGADALARKITALTGVLPRADLVLNPTEFTSPQLIGGLKAMVMSLYSLLDSEHAQISPVALKEVEQAIVIQFLYACRHNYSHFLEKDTGKRMPAHVQRAAEYIDANWREAISIEKLVEVSGASARTLFKAFTKIHGATPMLFVKKRRLEEARRMLTNGNHETSVKQVAFACAFSNTGHFAGYYRAMFGESPSETLARSRSPKMPVKR